MDKPQPPEPQRMHKNSDRETLPQALVAGLRETAYAKLMAQSPALTRLTSDQVAKTRAAWAKL